jgi:hypothetical protein
MIAMFASLAAFSLFNVGLGAALAMAGVAFTVSS